MIQILRPEQSLEGIRQRVQNSTQRPALIVGAEPWQGNDALYKRPGDTRYTHVGRLELFLSRLASGPCVRRADVSSGSTFYFDLSPATTLRVVYPVYREEHPDCWANPHFKAAGITPPLNGGVQTIFLTPHDRAVDLQLLPFVANHRKSRGNDVASGIKFAVSAAIEAPNVLCPKWHPGVAFGGQSYVAQTIQAPGHYHSYASVLYSPQAENRTCVVDRDPGGCVRCGGSSGERVHFGVVVIGTPSWPDGLLCRRCFPEAVKEWGEVLASWTPPTPPTT